MVTGVKRGVVLVLAACALMTAGPAAAEPDPLAPEPGTPDTTAAAEPTFTPVAVSEAVPPADDDSAVEGGMVASSPPQTTTAPDGWTLKISSKDETQVAVAPLTTAISTREYAVGGVFNGSLTGPGGEVPEGIFEVGYQIGCGIDMTTSNGVSLTGTAGVSPSIQLLGIDASTIPIDAVIPGIGANLGGAITVGLKPGLINIVPVTRKQYKGAAPWVSISNYRIKIDGCVGESFIRSFATLTKGTDEGDAILSWYGVTKAV